MIRDAQSTGFFSVATGDVSAYLSVTPGLHTHIDYHSELKKLLLKANVMKAIKMLPFSVLAGYGFVHHEESEWR